MPKPTAEDRPSKKLWDKSAWRGARFFLNYLRPHTAVYIPALIALTITASMTLWFFYELTSLAKLWFEGTRGEALVEKANRTLFTIIGISAGQAFIAFWRIWLFAKASERSLSSLRRDLFSHILRQPMAMLGQHRVGELASRLSNDVETMRETLVSTIPQTIRHTVMLIMSLGLVLSISVKLALFMVGCIPVVIVLIAIFGSQIRKLTRRAQDELAQSQVVVDESLQAITSVKAFANEPHETQRYDRAMDRFLNTSVRAALPRASFVAFIIFSFSVALALVVWFACKMVAYGEIDPQKLLLFGGFSGLIGASFMTLPELITSIQRALGATDRVREILDSAVEPASTQNMVPLRGDINMRNIRFAYPARPEATVLHDFSMQAAAGQRIALVGSSGAGKSTVVNLLFRFFEPQAGEILFDGQPASLLPLHGLRRNLALVPQEVLLFGGSIRENIEYGKPGATAEQVEEAARLANADEFIRKLPQAYDTLVGERGAQLSGGQRQRIAIARAILADPAILILDEATSSLDAESERLVQDALDKLMQNRTSIIIAHRLSTVRRADQILVMSGGAVIERGTHDQLIQHGSLYATLTKLQLG